MLCRLLFSPYLWRPSKHCHMKSLAAQSPSNCRQGQPLPRFPDGKRWWLHLCCFYDSPLFSVFLVGVEDRKQVGSETASCVHQLWFLSHSRLQCQGKHTHTKRDPHANKRRTVSQPLSANYHVHSFNFLHHQSLLHPRLASLHLRCHHTQSFYFSWTVQSKSPEQRQKCIGVSLYICVHQFNAKIFTHPLQLSINSNAIDMMMA